MPRNRRGRPPSPPELRRSERVVSFVTEDELRQLHALAKTNRATMSTIIHQLISEGLADGDRRRNNPLQHTSS